MGTQTFHSKVAAEQGTAAGELVTKSQLDSGVAAASALPSTTASLTDFTTAVNALVTAAITALINSSPSNLDTLKELADALGDDPNFATTITGLITTVGGRVTALEGAGFTQLVGDGAASTFNVDHNLGTTQVFVEVFKVSTGQTCYPLPQRTTNNRVVLDFGATVPAANEYRVLVRKAAV